MTRRRFGFIASAVAAAVTVLPPAAGAAPSNDDLDRAGVLATLPARAAGTTRGARMQRDEPTPSCGRLDRSVWYRMRNGRRGAIVVRLRAAGRMDAIVAVYLSERTRVRQVTCTATNRRGNALLAFYGRRNAEYLIQVGEARDSDSGDFSLRAVRPERRAFPPGRPLAAGGVRSTVDRLLDPDDAWSYRMERGRSYRINLLPSRTCVSAYLYRPRTYRFASEEPAAALGCGGYTLFTPGPDGGGNYSILVIPDRDRRGVQPYRLSVAPAESDDSAPGVLLGPDAFVRGTLSGRGIDLVDLYRFVVPQPSHLDVRLGNRPQAAFSVRVLRASGDRVTLEPRTRPGRVALRRPLPPGHYFLAVEAEDRSGGPYTLRLRVRGITRTDMLISGQRHVEAIPGAAQVLSAVVSAAGIGGRVRFQFDRYDPLFGWQFVGLVTVPVGPSGIATTSWVSPTAGHWRVRARFLGTATAASSNSRYARIFVAEPLDARR